MRKQTVLVVDDNIAFGRSLKLVLTALGFNVLVACHPLDALEAARLTKIFILITDFDLRVMQGDELARQLSQLQPIPRNIIMSSHELNPDEMKFSFDLMIPKPIQLAKLEEALISWLTDGSILSNEGTKNDKK